jgi:hypothetical protein
LRALQVIRRPGTGLTAGDGLPDHNREYIRKEYSRSPIGRFLFQLRKVKSPLDHGGSTRALRDAFLAAKAGDA